MLLSVMASCSGASRELLNILHHSAFLVSYTTISSIILSLAEQSIERARIVARGPFVLTYDNINISSSIFVEQRPNAMSKVQSGTVPVIYELPNHTQHDNLRIAPMIKRFKESSPLKISDLRASREAHTMYQHQHQENDMVFPTVFWYFQKVKRGPKGLKELKPPGLLNLGPIYLQSSLLALKVSN